LARALFFLPSSSVFELASWSDHSRGLVSDRAFPVRVFRPTTPLSPLAPPCRGGGRIVVGCRREIPGTGLRTDSSSRVPFVGRVPALFPSAAWRGGPPSRDRSASRRRRVFWRLPAAIAGGRRRRVVWRPPAAIAGGRRRLRRTIQGYPPPINGAAAAAHETASNDRHAVHGQDRASQGAAEAESGTCRAVGGGGRAPP